MFSLSVSTSEELAKKEIREPWKVSSISNSGQLKMSKRKLKNWGRISILTLEFLFPWERGDLKKNIINPSHVRAGTVSIKSIYLLLPV